MIETYKGMKKDMTCSKFQYTAGQQYNIKGDDIKLCKKGFHACKNPIDVFNYYPPDGQNRFFSVEQDGIIVNGDDKTVSSQINIKAELSLKDMFSIDFKMIFDKVRKSSTTKNTAGNEAHANTAGYKAHANTAGNEAHANTAGDEAHANTAGYKAHANTAGYYAHANTAGNEAHANTAGNEAHANTAGNYAHANTAGDEAHANTAGDEAHANTAGYKAHANTAGNYAHANTAGNYAHANTAGYKAHANTAGDEAIACSLGIQSRAKAIKGWIVIVDWQYAKNRWFVKNIHHAKVGQKIKGVKIKPDVWYWFEGGNLICVKN